MFEDRLSVYDFANFSPPRTRFRPRFRPLFQPMIVGVALAAITLAGQTRLGAWLRGFFSSSTGRDFDRTLGFDFTPSENLTELRQYILGRNMAMVVMSFGQPRTVQTSEGVVSDIADIGAGGFWRSNLWYYPVDAQTYTAMAIHFDAGIAQQVDFFDLTANV